MPYLVIMLMVLLGQGCASKDEHALRDYIKKVNERPPKPIMPFPGFKKAEKYEYRSAKLRDPFKPYHKLRASADNTGPDQTRKKEPLEAFSLDGLSMVGTLTQDEAIWALIQAPNKMVYKVRPGNYLGKNYGKIVSVAKSDIRIEEMYRFQGVWEKRTITLKLATEQ